MTKTIAIIPAYNEETTVGEVVRQTKQFVDDVFVIDDGSKDKTDKIAIQNKATVLTLINNMGIGFVLQRGYNIAVYYSPYDNLVQLDADGQHNPQYLPDALRALTDADMVIGSRFLNDSYKSYPLVRRIGIRFFSWFMSLFSKNKITDVTSGFRAYRVDKLKELSPLPSRHWALHQTLEAALKGFRIKEVSIPMPYRSKGKSQFSFKVYSLYPLRMMWIAIKVLVRYYGKWY